MSRGSAAADGRFAYITPAGMNLIYQYEWNTDKWKELPRCPYRDAGLVIFENKLTAIGGYDGSRCIKKLATLVSKSLNWTKDSYPSMRNAYASPGVVGTSGYLIVIGGEVCVTTTVDLYDSKERKWYELKSLRIKNSPVNKPFATISGDRIYMIEAGGQGYSCYVALLLSQQSLSIENVWQREKVC